jgi:hypothetical protein
LPVRAAAAKVFSAVQGVGGEQGAAHAELLDQGPRRRDLLGRGTDLPVGQDQGGLAGERAEHVRGGRVVQVVEAAPEGLAVQGDDGRRARPRRRLVQPPGVAAESRLEVGGIEGQEQVAQRVHGRDPAQAGAEGGVQALPVHVDERQDAAVGGGAGQHGEGREQEQVGQRVAPALAAARVGDLRKGCEQSGERDHGCLHDERRRLNDHPSPPVPTSQRGSRPPHRIRTEQP